MGEYVAMFHLLSTVSEQYKSWLWYLQITGFGILLLFKGKRNVIIRRGEVQFDITITLETEAISGDSITINH